MALVKNSDYSVGYTRNLNQYELDTDEAQKYRYHQLRFSTAYKIPDNSQIEKARYQELLKLSTKRDLTDYKAQQAYKYLTELKDTQAIIKGYNYNGSGFDSSSFYGIFNEKLQNFAFAPPSDNFWTVQIHPAGQTQGGLTHIFRSAKYVNQIWEGNNAETWKIDTKSIENKTKNNNNTNNEVENFLNLSQDNTIGLFLAQRINFTPLSVNYDTNPFGEIQQHGGFYKNAKVIKSRKDDDTLKINFLVSNWDLGDILFDPWIAAISQYGLIMDDTDDITLKATIILTEYSTNSPDPTDNKKDRNTLEARKEYIFENCFPVSREAPEKTYEPNDAGVYKNSIVTFIYDTYKIRYKF